MSEADLPPAWREPVALRRTVWLDGKDVPRRPWDVATGTTAAALARFSRALLVTRSISTDSFIGCRSSDAERLLGRGVTADWRVFIPVGRESLFRDEAKPEDIRPPGRMRVGSAPPACDAGEPLMPGEFRLYPCRFDRGHAGPCVRL